MTIAKTRSKSDPILLKNISMFSELTPVEICVNELNMLDDKQQKERANDSTLIKGHEQHMQAAITQAINTITSKQDISYAAFIPLYACVKQLKTLNIHSNPRWDKFWKKQNTNSLKAGLGLVRHAAMTIIDKYLTTLFNTNPTDTLKIRTIVQSAMALDLFKLPRSNWPVKSPSKELSDWISKLDDIEKTKLLKQDTILSEDCPTNRVEISPEKEMSDWVSKLNDSDKMKLKNNPRLAEELTRLFIDRSRQIQEPPVRVLDWTHGNPCNM